MIWAVYTALDFCLIVEVHPDSRLEELWIKQDLVESLEYQQKYGSKLPQAQRVWSFLDMIYCDQEWPRKLLKTAGSHQPSFHRDDSWKIAGSFECTDTTYFIQIICQIIWIGYIVPPSPCIWTPTWRKTICPLRSQWLRTTAHIKQSCDVPRATCGAWRASCSAPKGTLECFQWRHVLFSTPIRRYSNGPWKP